MTGGRREGEAAIVWLRDDLRLADNPALHEAARSGRPILVLFVLEEVGGEPSRGAASLWWLHHSLAALGGALEQRGVELVLRRGDPARVLPETAKACRAGRVYCNRRYGRAGRRDRDIAETLRDEGVELVLFSANLLHDPERLLTRSGTPYRVFTPFWKALAAEAPPRSPLPAPGRLEPAPDAPRGEDLADWHLLPTMPDWAGGLREAWEPGEHGGRERLRRFVESRLGNYAEGRDRPDRDDTSGLSPHLHFGEISPVQVWHAIDRHATGRNGEKFLSELAWRDFSYHLLDHSPDLGEANFNERFDAFPWDRNEKALEAWRTGRTGYPIVDAGMRQLWHQGWMHNRVRLIVGSFLVKDLMIDWRVGAAWFWDTLVDADPANNAASWQWVAGSGADAAPYFRIFNPVLQGERHDPEGDYVRRWVPELSRLPKRWIHKPWQAPEDVLAEAGVRLGDTYPRPVVDHSVARQRALALFQELPRA
ncbi:cryptochrome/photolyase family protein [Lutibaculum baratangense]|uniref:Deoxyribodipyrimidine photo-lyase n=1 Tax=Lutibaculum baratangense AMV1 TaxID=631454 RepID=V4QUV1_9HYPH|nr:deoxyribodipyrimidine photo-lyase [Lutibaculum baratangense]ESR23522.1 Deoxyribodipyrimidine photolyase [Lutibaculum baratangense AMV1]